MQQNKGINLLSKDIIEKAKTSTGVMCPTCNRNIKAYKRTITPTMAVALIEIYKYYKYAENVTTDDYFKSKDVFFRLDPKMYADYTKLYYWDLIEPEGSHPTKFIKKRGSWRITENGIKFAQLEIALPKFATIYNKEVSEHETPAVMIDEILNNVGIDYKELINLIE